MLHGNGLSLVTGALFTLFMAAQAVTGLRVHNEELGEHGEPPVGFVAYVASGHFLEATAENWESEFLALVAMVVLSIYLRRRGSPESKPVDAPHSHTGSQ